MSYHYPGLFARNRLFYFRVRIPENLRVLARATEIKYSLNTSVYQEAIEKWRVEFAHLQAFLTIFKDIIMKVNEQKQIVLNKADVDKLLLHRLEQIQHFLENNVDEIKSRHKNEGDIILFPSGKKEADIRKLMQDMILDYLKGLVDKNKANITLRTVYQQLRDKEIELGLVQKDDKYDWLKAFSTHISQLDHYAQKSVKAIQKDKHYAPTNPKVITLLRTYDSQKTDERIHHSMAATHWEKFFRRFASMKQNLKGIGNIQLDNNYLAVQLCFGLIEKDYVEEVVSQDCRKLCERIYHVPKRWHTEIKKGKKITQILTDVPERAIAKATIKSILISFKEYMRYAVKEELIQNSLNDFIDMPMRTEGLKRTPFTTQEIKKIFDPQFYPDPHSRKNQAKFWVPIIALYHGCRLNEICQMDVNDVVQEKGIPCFSINSDSKDKSLKNSNSIRTIPIHPKLIDMGFLMYVDYQRKSQQTKLFSELTKTKRNGYGKIVQSWFGRHLDHLGIKGRDKVFHSFRHTFETTATNKKIPPQYQNAICGWYEAGVGQRVYAHKKDINAMLEELMKINYPINHELSALKKKFMDSYAAK